MNEYISREAVLKALKLKVKNPKKDYQRGMQDAIDCLVPEVIADIPAADVQPVKRGKWIKKDGDPWRTEYKCSECGADLNAGCAWNNHPEQCDKYCYNCGAKMDLGDEKT